MTKTLPRSHAWSFCAALVLSAIGWASAVAHEESRTDVPDKVAAEDGQEPDNCSGFSPSSARPGEPGNHGRAGKVSERFPNIVLRTHCGTPVRFYDDLVKDRTVVVNFMYTTCSDICPGTTQNLTYLYEYLGRRVGRDILMLSISIDPQVDTPEVLKSYAEIYGGPKDGWLYLTGDYDEIDLLRRRMGVYDLDPVIDADKTQHSGILTFGNDSTDRWAALPALMNSKALARTILRITRGPKAAGPRH